MLLATGGDPHPPQIDMAFPPSAIQMKRLALETGATQVKGDVEVSPEGQFFVRGTKATLNEAIVELARQAA